MRVLIAVDGSPHSHAAILELSGRPWPLGTEVRIVTVDAPIDESTLRAGGVTAYDVFVQRQRAEAAAVLAAAAETFRRLAPAHVTVTTAVLEGSPKREIIAEAERWGAELVAVGSQGRGAVKSIFLGSVSLAVVIGAPCSVLVVREQPDASQSP